MVEAHRHDGVDNPEILFQDLDKSDVKQAALTTKDDTVLSTGGSDDLKTEDADVIDNNRTRIEEIETKLQALGLFS